ncbi:hypothetical protein GGX14DRAFT_392385 [Mycena pura]|uniref:Uncharacterized protein n=1 Tax=Mycena pura TaxID=153505 RepID=A0AAD6VMC6_9AGAR|nr:hypothetical protein GGX14DRAFT_392385 [Mycena pura]
MQSLCGCQHHSLHHGPGHPGEAQRVDHEEKGVDGRTEVRPPTDWQTLVILTVWRWSQRYAKPYLPSITPVCPSSPKPSLAQFPFASRGAVARRPPLRKSRRRGGHLDRVRESKISARPDRPCSGKVRHDTTCRYVHATVAEFVRHALVHSLVYNSLKNLPVDRTTSSVGPGQYCGHGQLCFAAVSTTRMRAGGVNGDPPLVCKVDLLGRKHGTDTVDTEGGRVEYRDASSVLPVEACTQRGMDVWPELDGLGAVGSRYDFDGGTRREYITTGYVSVGRLPCLDDRGNTDHEWHSPLLARRASPARCRSDRGAFARPGLKLPHERRRRLPRRFCASARRAGEERDVYRLCAATIAASARNGLVPAYVKTTNTGDGTTVPQWPLTGSVLEVRGGGGGTGQCMDMGIVFLRTPTDTLSRLQTSLYWHAQKANDGRNPPSRPQRNRGTATASSLYKQTRPSRLP